MNREVNSYLFLSMELILLVFILSCRWISTPPDRYVNVDDLLVDESLLPPNWQVLMIDNDPIISWGEESAVEMIFFFEGDTSKLTRGGITIYHQKNNDLASKHYRDQSAEFNPDYKSATTPLYVPEELMSFMPSADEWRLACRGISPGFLDDTSICKFLGRYQDIVVDFSIVLEYKNQSTVKMKDLFILLTDIDKQIRAGNTQF